MQQTPILFSTNDRSLNLQFILQTLLAYYDRSQPWNVIRTATPLLDNRRQRDLLPSIPFRELANRVDSKFETDRSGPDLKKLHFYCNRLIQTSTTSPDTLQLLLYEMYVSTQFDDILPKLFTALLPFFDEIGRDERLLSYCLEYREKFNQLFGLRTIETLLLRLFPLGIAELRLYLRKKYDERGFHDYSAQQEDLLSQLRL